MLLRHVLRIHLLRELKCCHGFAANDANQQASYRWVLARDVRRLDETWGRQILSRGNVRKYRSTIAFPLRYPSHGPSSAQVAQLVGFLSIDCPDPDAFDGLFDLADGKVEPGVHGEGFVEHEDMNLFFGLADSVATILVLNGKAQKASSLPPGLTQ